MLGLFVGVGLVAVVLVWMVLAVGARCGAAEEAGWRERVARDAWQRD